MRHLARAMRDALRLLLPSVRREREYTLRRSRALGVELAAASRLGPEWSAGRQWGQGFDERVVELPWVVARLGQCARMLDVGSALNSPALIEAVKARCDEVVFLNPFPDDAFRSAQPGVSYVAADVRRHWLAPGSFDVVTCVSTLEHIGCDNSRYGAPPGREPDPAQARLAAMRAMRELCASGGRLLLTVPLGRLEDHGWFVQLDEAALQAAIAAFAPSHAEVERFIHAGMWRRADAAECEGVAYGAATRGASAVACVELHA